MAAIIDAVQSGEIADSTVEVVVSDKLQAVGLEKARDKGVEAIVIERSGRTSEEHDTEIVAALKGRGVELICLAGYMRLLSPLFVNAFPDKIINIHPSLLPAYPGLNVHERVLAAGETRSGCTVHFVNEELDAGPIILQREVPVLDGDTPDTLAARILDHEHGAYVDAIKMIVSGNVETSSLEANTV
jgi:phosphoribosylglycinamide formyltransferase-1